jgi:hypothetical protein
MDNRTYDCNNCLCLCSPCIAMFMACENLLKCICCFPCYLDCDGDKKVHPESIEL